MHRSLPMTLTDAELVAQWNRRSRRWTETLVSVRQEQASTLGCRLGPMQWFGSPNLGPWTWFGYFWEPEQFWFGFGFDGRLWQPLLEVDSKQASSQSWLLLRRQLPAQWRFSRNGTFLRLWSELDAGSTAPRAQFSWLRARGRELHEYSVG